MLSNSCTLELSKPPFGIQENLRLEKGKIFTFFTSAGSDIGISIVFEFQFMRLLGAASHVRRTRMSEERVYEIVCRGTHEYEIVYQVKPLALY